MEEFNCINKLEFKELLAQTITSYKLLIRELIILNN